MPPLSQTANRTGNTDRAFGPQRSLICGHLPPLCGCLFRRGDHAEGNRSVETRQRGSAERGADSRRGGGGVSGREAIDSTVRPVSALRPQRLFDLRSSAPALWMPLPLRGSPRRKCECGDEAEGIRRKGADSRRGGRGVSGRGAIDATLRRVSALRPQRFLICGHLPRSVDASSAEGIAQKEIGVLRRGRGDPKRGGRFAQMHGSH